MNSTMRSQTAVAIALVALSTWLVPSARACGSSTHDMSSLGALPSLPMSLPSASPQDDSDASVTGLWKTAYVSGGAVVNVGFDTFHSDGTELALDGSFPPALGNVCPGVWEKIGPRSYTTVHPAFNYDSAGINIVSIFIEHVHITLSANGNSFAGNFTWDNFDFQGNLLPGSVAGTLTGARISVGKPFPFPFPL